MYSTKRRILSRIQKSGRGSLWCADDFLPLFHRHEIDESFVRLTREGVICRVITGIYEYPRISSVLQCPVPTDINELAYVLARKFRWEICPDGETALNYLGLSTQISGHSIFLSNGPNREYNVSGQELHFHHSANRWLKFKKTESLMLVQGLIARGESSMSDEDFRILSNRFSQRTWGDILKDISAAQIWIVEKIRNICQQERI